MNNYDHQLADPRLRITLPRRSARFYHTFEIGRALGYRRIRAPIGVWSARIASGSNRYIRRNIGLADDLQKANGNDILSFQQALTKAKAWCRHPEQSRRVIDPRPRGPTLHLIACPCGPVYTVGHALAEYVEWKRTFAAESSFYSIIHVLNGYVYPRLGTLPADKLTTDDIRELLEHVIVTPRIAYLRRWGHTFDPSSMDPETRRRRQSSANHVLSILRGALNHAWEQGKIEDDRVWRRVPHFKGAKRARVDFLTRHECRKLLAACEPDFRQIIMGLLFTGCRITELTNLTAADVSKVRMAIFVRTSKHYGSRHIALPEEGYKFFKSLAFLKERDSPLFVRANGKPWSRYVLIARLRRALAQANLPREYVFHTMRHTYTSLRLQEGLSPIAVARQLGHKDARTVLQFYAHCADDFIDREIREKFQSLFDDDDALADVDGLNG